MPTFDGDVVPVVVDYRKVGVLWKIFTGAFFVLEEGCIHQVGLFSVFFGDLVDVEDVRKWILLILGALETEISFIYFFRNQTIFKEWIKD